MVEMSKNFDLKIKPKAIKMDRKVIFWFFTQK